MKTRHLYTNLFAALLACCCFSACNKEAVAEETGDCKLVVDLSVEDAIAGTRAVQDYVVADYPGRYYLYDKGGAYIASGDIEEDNFLLTGIPADRGELTLVLLASPKENPVTFPGSDVQQGYTGTTLTYQQGSEYNAANITRDVYRDVIKFTPTIGINDVYGVLTRQNGALEVRIKNMDIASAALQLTGTRTMYIHDGTGGQVFSKDEISLEKTMENLKGQNDIRIRINLLPQEDITTGNTVNDPNVSTAGNKLTITYTDGTKKEYDIQSDQGAIPVYPNQITWLTLNGNDNGGTFDVTFSGKINLEDDKWDGWE